MSDEPKIIHVRRSTKRDGLPNYDQDAPCPKCGGETKTGFGMAGGGFGIYAYCETCGIITSKSELPE